MPARSAKQQRFFGAELARAREGDETKTGMATEKLAEMAAKPKGGYKKLKSGSLPTHGSGALSPIGQRVVAGYESKYGKEAGHDKFEQAIKDGRIDRSKMFKEDQMTAGPTPTKLLKRKAEGKFSSRTGR